MALMHCPECGRQVSDKAATCPQCAFPLAAPPQAASGRTRDEGKASVDVGSLEPRGFWETWLFLFVYFGVIIALLIAGLITVGRGRMNLDVFGIILTGGLASGALMASIVTYHLKAIKTVVPVTDKNKFVTRLTVGMGELRFRLKSNEGDYLVFEPPGIALKILPLNPARFFEVIVILDADSATIMGPRTPVNKVLSRLVSRKGDILD